MIWPFPSRWESCALRHKRVLHGLLDLLLLSIYNCIRFTRNKSFFDSSWVCQLSLLDQTKVLLLWWCIGSSSWLVLLWISFRATDYRLDAIIGWGSDIHEGDYFWPFIDAGHLPLDLILCHIGDILSEHVLFLVHAEIDLICRFAIYFLTHCTFLN